MPKGAPSAWRTPWTGDAHGAPRAQGALPAVLEVPDLLHCKLIHVDGGGWWNSWFAALGVRQCVKADTSHVSNDIVLNLARAGHGIALATDVLVEKELTEGSLVRCVACGVPLESYQVLTPTQAPGEDALWFIAWLRGSLRTGYPEAAWQSPTGDVQTAKNCLS